jgi:hypothetical protein
LIDDNLLLAKIEDIAMSAFYSLPQYLSLLTDVVVLTPSDEILPSAYPSAKLNSATSSIRIYLPNSGK